MTTTQSPTFGLLLRRHRRAAGLTQEELAEQAGLSVRAIGDLERGVRFSPRRDTLELLIDALRLSPDEQSALRTAARAAVGVPAGGDPGAHLLEAGSFLGAIPADVMVGRETELHRLLAPLDAVAGGHGRMALIAGEPGVGKTRLAQEVTMEAGKRGFLVSTGRYYEPQRAVPFYGFIEALATLETAVPEAIRQQIPLQWPYLDALLTLSAPEVGSVARLTGRLEEQLRLFQSVSGFLQAVAAVLPVAVLLDDLHWADSASLQLLLYLARYTRGNRVLMVGTYRDVEVGRGHPLERALVDLNRERLVERVVVHRLESKGTAALVGATLGEAEAATDLTTRIHRYTDGNPFFVQEVIRALIERGDLYLRHEHWLSREVRDIRVPETIRSAIVERVSHLQPDAQSLLYEASVLGPSFAYRDLRQLSGRAEHEVEAGLDAAVSTGSLEEGDHDTYTFSHALIQQTLYDDLGARRRRRLHIAAGTALERLPPAERDRRATELVWHFTEGGDTDRALTYATLAGDRAQQGFAWGEAERYYRDAVELATREGDATPVVAADAYSRLGRVLHVTERYDEALVTLEQAAQLYAAIGDVSREAQLIAEIGWAHNSRGTGEQGIARIRPLLESLEGHEPAPVEPWVLAALYTALARIYFGLGRFHEELAAAERAAELARLVDKGGVLAVAEARRGAVLMSLGRRGQAQQVLEAAIGLAEASGNIGTMSVALDNLAEIHRDGGRFARSRECLLRALDLARLSAVPGRIAWTLVSLGRVSFLMGSRQEARDAFTEASGILRSDDRPSLALEAMLETWQLIMSGEGGARRPFRQLEAIVASADPKRDLWTIRYVQHVLANVDLLEGKPEAALTRLEGLLDRPGLEEPLVNPLLWVMAEAHVELGHEEEAERIIADTMRRARAADQLTVVTELIRIRAMLRDRQRRWDESRAAFDEAVTYARQMPYLFAEARCRFHWGTMEDRAGNVERARQLLAEASAMFGELGDRMYVERVRQTGLLGSG
jgi:tetratricopeptide (TPR) repeat protein/transcriptional regulator with XRE-family HTH domain